MITVYIVAWEDEYETLYGDGKYFHYMHAFLNNEEAEEYADSQEANRIMKVMVRDDNAILGLPWCDGWDKTLRGHWVRFDLERPSRAKANCAAIMEDLMKVVWHPKGRMMRMFLVDDEV